MAGYRLGFLGLVLNWQKIDAEYSRRCRILGWFSGFNRNT